MTNAAAAKFALNVPTNITAGAPFSLKVTVLDAYGNKVKNYFGTVHFSTTAGLPACPRTTPSTLPTRAFTTSRSR